MIAKWHLHSCQVTVSDTQMETWVQQRRGDPDGNPGLVAIVSPIATMPVVSAAAGVCVTEGATVRTHAKQCDQSKAGSE